MPDDRTLSTKERALACEAYELLAAVTTPGRPLIRERSRLVAARQHAIKQARYQANLFQRVVWMIVSTASLALISAK